MVRIILDVKVIAEKYRKVLAGEHF